MRTSSWAPSLLLWWTGGPAPHRTESTVSWAPHCWAAVGLGTKFLARFYGLHLELQCEDKGASFLCCDTPTPHSQLQSPMGWVAPPGPLQPFIIHLE